MAANEGKLDRGKRATTKPIDDAIPKEEKKVVEKVVTGHVRKQKKSFLKKLKEAIFGDKESVGDYVIYDVLVPAAKDTLAEMVKGGIEMLIYGENKSRGRVYRDRGRSYTSYDKVSYREKERERDRTQSARARHDFDDIVLTTRGEAEDVLEHLVELTVDYGQASVADFYELVGVESTYADNKYGWFDLVNASVSRVRGGYLINLPRTQLID